MWGDILSTVGDVQYRGGYLEYSTIGGYDEYRGGYLVGHTQYHGGYHDARVGIS